MFKDKVLALYQVEGESEILGYNRYRMPFYLHQSLTYTSKTGVKLLEPSPELKWLAKITNQHSSFYEGETVQGVKFKADETWSTGKTDWGYDNDALPTPLRSKISKVIHKEDIFNYDRQEEVSPSLKKLLHG